MRVYLAVAVAFGCGGYALTPGPDTLGRVLAFVLCLLLGTTALLLHLFEEDD